TADHALLCDVTKAEELERALEAAARDADGGAPDVLVYAAGIAAMGRAVAVPPADARAVFEVSFWGLERAVRAVYPAMSRRGAGAIVAILSLAGVRAVPFEAHYGAAKAAAARYLEALALEAAQAGVRVGFLAPGLVETGFLERATWHGMVPPRVRGSGVTAD